MTGWSLESPTLAKDDDEVVRELIAAMTDGSAAEERKGWKDQVPDPHYQDAKRPCIHSQAVNVSDQLGPDSCDNLRPDPAANSIASAFSMSYSSTLST